MAFDKNLKALRLENKMTQENVAQQVNLARSTIAGYETKNRQPSYEKLSAFCKLFHVSMDDLLEDNAATYSTPNVSPFPGEPDRNKKPTTRTVSKSKMVLGIFRSDVPDTIF